MLRSLVGSEMCIRDRYALVILTRISINWWCGVLAAADDMEDPRVLRISPGDKDINRWYWTSTCDIDVWHILIVSPGDREGSRSKPCTAAGCYMEQLAIYKRKSWYWLEYQSIGDVEYQLLLMYKINECLGYHPGIQIYSGVSTCMIYNIDWWHNR